MTQTEKDEIKDCILFYEELGWDWSSAVGFLIAKYDGYLNAIINPARRCKMGHPAVPFRRGV